MQYMQDNPLAALGIVASLGCVLACLYMIYHSAMIAVCWRRDTPPEQRQHTRPMYGTLPNTAKLHHRKALMGMLAFFGFFLLILGVRLLLPN